jgi:transcriptional regulator with XRE-family HTH domain
MKKRLDSYVRANRLRSGFTQKELAFIIGVKTRTFISYLEGRKRKPKLEIAFALHIVFGAEAADLFPGLFAGVEESVIARAYDLYESLQGNASKTARAKLDFLERIFERAKLRIRSNEHV